MQYWDRIDWSDVFERALSTFWQVVLVTLPTEFVLDWAVWQTALIHIGMAAGGAVLSVIKNVVWQLMQERSLDRSFQGS